MSDYKRTTLYLEEETIKELKLKAINENCTMSELIRKGINIILQEEKQI